MERWNGHWQYPTRFDVKDWHGFTYAIINNLNGRKYIGKKVFHFKKTSPPLKGKTRKRIAYAKSDWKWYTGSCNELNNDIEKYGKEHFTFIMLQLHASRYSLSHDEAHRILTSGALLSGNYYNNSLQLRLGPAPKGMIK